MVAFGCGDGSATDPDAPLSPSAAGFDTEALSAGLELLAATDGNAHRIVVARDGITALDIDLWPSSDDMPHDLASLTKSVVAIDVGAALERSDLDSLDVPIGDLLTLPADSAVAASSLRDILRMRAGLDCSLDGGEPRLAEMLTSSDFVATAAAIPAAGTTGETFAYCSPGYHLVSAAMTELTGTSFADYADTALFTPLGIDDFTWEADAQGITHGWGDLALRATDAARIGDLVAAGGEWRGERLLPFRLRRRAPHRRADRRPDPRLRDGLVAPHRPRQRRPRGHRSGRPGTPGVARGRAGRRRDRCSGRRSAHRPNPRRPPLTIGDTLYRLPLALDGAGTVVTDSPTGAPVHLTGIWDGDRLVVDYEEVFGPEHWTIELDLEAELVMTVTDLGEGFAPITVAALP